MKDPIFTHSRLFTHRSNLLNSLIATFYPLVSLCKSHQSYFKVKKVTAVCILRFLRYDTLLGNLLSLYLHSQLTTALFPYFSYRVLGILLRLVGVREAAALVWFSLLWEYFRAFRKWESTSLGLSGSVGILPSGSGQLWPQPKEHSS